MYKPLPNNLTINTSSIHDFGIFAKEDIPEGTDLGISHYRKGDDVIRTPLGGFINHSEDPNVKRTQIRIEPYWDKWIITTIKDIKKGKEITLKYTMSASLASSLSGLFFFSINLISINLNKI